MAIPVSRVTLLHFGFGPTFGATRAAGGQRQRLASLCLRVLVVGIAIGLGIAARGAVSGEAAFTVASAIALWTIAAP